MSQRASPYLDALLGRLGTNPQSPGGPMEPPRTPVQTPGYQAPADTPSPQAQPAAPKFNLQGAQLHGRAMSDKDPNDLLWYARSQPGFDVSSNDAVRKSYNEIINPLFQQQGLNPSLMEHEKLDKLNVGGRTLDFVRNSGGANPEFAISEDGMGGGMASPGMGRGMNTGGLNGLLTGDPMAGIQNAIGQYGGQSDFLQALLKRLGGGQ